MNASHAARERERRSLRQIADDENVPNAAKAHECLELAASVSPMLAPYVVATAQTYALLALRDELIEISTTLSMP